MRALVQSSILRVLVVIVVALVSAAAFADESAVAEASYRRLSLAALNYEGLPVQLGDIPTLKARPGQTLVGSFSALFEHDYAESQVCPLAVTPNWGDRQTAYWQVVEDMVNGETYSSNFELVMPDTIGTYFIIIASHNEYNAGQIVSATHWSTAWDPVWDDGNDLFDWDETTLEAAAASGEVVVPYLDGTGETNVAACVIRVVVTDNFRRLTFQDLTFDGEVLDPVDPVLYVEPGGTISGDVNLLFETTYAASNFFPLVGLPTWGDREANYWQLASSMANGSVYGGSVDLVAPVDPGVYYILFATHSEYDVANIASATHWSANSAPIWYDGDDLIDWPQFLVDEAVADGTVLAPQYTGVGIFGARALRVEVGTVPDLHRNLQLASLTYRDMPVDLGNPLIRTHPGETISGSFSVAFGHDYPESHVYPLVAVPTWGDAETGYWQVSGDMEDGGSYGGDFNLTVPTEPGDYYLVLASHNEYDAGQIASATHWSYNWDSIWDDGNEIRDWSQTAIDSAMAVGEVIVPYASNAGESNVAACAIRIQVGDEFRQLDLIAATINGTALDPLAPLVRVQPGQVINGDYTVQFSTNYSASNTFPLVAVPTWGDRTQNFWSDASSMVDGSSYVGSISLTAPDEPGVYHLILATHSEFDADRVASATHWSQSVDPIWFNGDDIADWPAPVLEEATVDGSVIVPFYQTGTSSVGARVIRIEVDGAPADYRRLQLVDSELNGSHLLMDRPTVRVAPGEAIFGSYSVLFEHSYPESHVYPLCVTPDWGDRETVFWQARGDMSDGGVYDGAIDLMAPDSNGVYYIILATHPEYHADQIASGSHWSYLPDPVWYDGNDILDWSEETIEAAMTSGMVTVPWGSNAGVSDVAACAVRVVVSDLYRKLTLTSADVNGEILDPADPEIRVTPYDPIVGTFSVVFETNYPASNAFPLAVAPNWGDKRTNFWQESTGMSSGGTYGGTIDLHASLAVGVHYLIIATHSEYTVGQIVTATHWSASETLRWGNGDDLYDWPDAVVERAMAQGSANVPYYGPGASSVGACAIRIVVSEPRAADVPVADIRDVALGNAYPNPFNPLTRFYFDLPSAGLARLTVYDIAGRCVKTLVDGHMAAGRHEEAWDGTNQSGGRMASGTYFLRLEAAGLIRVQSMNLVK